MAVIPDPEKQEGPFSNRNPIYPLSPRDSKPRRKPGKKKSNLPTPEPLKPLESPPEINAFTEWEKLGDEVQAAIAEMGITKPTPIQALSIGPGLDGRDIIAKAETGTGKTLAFGAPMVAKIDPARRTVLGLVLSPTRELAQQVYEVLQTLGEKRGLKANLIVGGEPMGPQVRNLQDGAQIVVGTPGRVLDLMEQGFLSFPWTEFVVLDEADKMLEIGFIDDIRKILAASNEYRQTLLFSATFPPALLHLGREHTNNPLEVATSSGVSTADTVSQYFLPVRGDDRTRDLRDLIRASGEKDVFLVFCDRRTDVDKMMRNLERERFSVKALHGGYDQASRFRVMDAFRTGDVKVLVATDVASRGLDVNHVTVVVNLNAPRDVSDYTHRIGRTGRAGRKGIAVTFVGGMDQRNWRDIEGALPVDVTRLESARSLFEKPRRDRQDSDGRGHDGDRPRKEGRGRERNDSRSRSRSQDRDGSRDNGRDRDREERSERGRPSRKDSDSSRVRSRGRSEGPDRDEERPRKREREERPRRERNSSPRDDGDRNSGREERTPRRGERKRNDRPDRDSKAPAKKAKSRSETKPTKKKDSGSGFGAGL